MIKSGAFNSINSERTLPERTAQVSDQKRMTLPQCGMNKGRKIQFTQE
jgi:hypothetical protein